MLDLCLICLLSGIKGMPGDMEKMEKTDGRRIHRFKKWPQKLTSGLSSLSWWWHNWSFSGLWLRFWAGHRGSFQPQRLARRGAGLWNNTRLFIKIMTIVKIIGIIIVMTANIISSLWRGLVCQKCGFSSIVFIDHLHPRIHNHIIWTIIDAHQHLIVSIIMIIKTIMIIMIITLMLIRWTRVESETEVGRRAAARKIHSPKLHLQVFFHSPLILSPRSWPLTKMS